MRLTDEVLEETLHALKRFRSKAAAADALGIPRKTFSYRLKIAQETLDLKLLEGQQLSGVSVYQSKNKDGKWEDKRRWVKSDREKEDFRDSIIDLIEASKEETVKYQPRIFNESYQEDVCQVIPIGDAHIGMFAWDEETGGSWDLDIAEKHMCFAFDYLVSKADPAGKCFIFNVGDYFHYHAMESKTERSGHVLDASGRPQNMFSTGLRIMRYAIERNLSKHGKVEVVNASGNHDGLLAFALSSSLSNIYENEPRVIIRTEPTMRHYSTFGKNLFGVVHGHQTKDQELPLIMATEVPELWGGSINRRWFRGHHHHDMVVKLGKEYNGCFVEQVRTLAEGDAYASGGGYLSGNDMKQYCYHKDGELEDFASISGRKIKRLLL